MTAKDYSITGVFPIRVQRAIHRTSAAGNPMVELRLVVTGEVRNGHEFRDYVMMPPHSAARWHSQKVFALLGEDSPDYKALMGSVNCPEDAEPPPFDADDLAIALTGSEGWASCVPSEHGKYVNTSVNAKAEGFFCGYIPLSAYDGPAGKFDPDNPTYYAWAHPDDGFEPIDF